MSHVKEAVLELTSAIHNWRSNPSVEHLHTVVIKSDALAGYSLHLEHALERVAESTPNDRCKCGGLTVPCHLAGATVPITKCTTCDTMFALVNLSGGPHA